MNTTVNPTNDPFLEEEEIRNRKRAHVGNWLRELNGKQDAVLAQVGHMADSISFTFTRTLKWIASDTKLASDLPFFSSLKDPITGEIVIDEDNIDLVRQRPVDWSRQEELARYLVAEPLHQFPPLLLVITTAWAEDENAPEWDEHGRATKSTFEYQPLGDFDGMVELSLDPAKYAIYALDGQHRVVGIRGAIEMVNSGQFQPKDKSGKAKGANVQRDEWLGDERTLSDVNKLPGETIGVQLIPGVIKGETMTEAQRRVASVFVHVNQTAAPLKDGDLTLIDRNDGCADVAKHIATKHPLFAGTKRVNWSNNTISKRSTLLTTLSTLKTCAKLYLQEDADFESWFVKKGRGKTVSRRPSDAEINKARQLLSDIWTRIAELPSFQILASNPASKITEMRNFTAEGGQAHMLYRPIGQQVLIQAVGVLLHKPDVALSLDKIFEALHRHDAAGGFRLDDPSNPWYNVIYSDSLGKMVVSGKELANELLVYLVAGGSLPERDALRKKFAEARKSREGQAWDLNGNEVPADQVKLPPVL